MGSLYVRVIHERVSRSVTLPYRIYPEEWNPVEHRLLFPSENLHRFQKLKRIETELEHVKLFLEDAVDRLEAEGRAFNSNDVIAIYRVSQGKDLFSAFTEKICNDLVRIGQDRTARAYRTVKSCLIAFTGNKYLRLKQINSILIRNFEQDLRIKGRTLNTISFYMRNLRAIYNRAVREGLLAVSVDNPFGQVYTGIQVTKKRSLSKEEMMKLYEFALYPVKSIDRLCLLDRKTRVHSALSNRRSRSSLPTKAILESASDELRRALLLFLFAFQARGMSFVDLAYLKKENINEQIIRYYRKKTGRLLEIRVTSDMEKIMRYFSLETRDSPYVFPIIHRDGVPEILQYESALRLQNKRLKVIGRLCGLRKTLSTHVARHTWATVAKGELLPIAVISEGLGHTSERTTAIYLASLDREVLDDASEKVTNAIKSVG